MGVIQLGSIRTYYHLITIIITSLSTLSNTGQARFLSASSFVQVSASGLYIQPYSSRTGLRTCTDCASSCLDDGATAPKTCMAFRCDSDSSTITCTFYSRETTQLVSPGVVVYLFQAHDVFHTVIYNDKRYNIYMSSTGATFSQGRSHCQSLGGYPLQLDTLDETVALQEVTHRQLHGQAYIGISDADVEGTWVTDREGAPISTGRYAWAYGEPNGGGYENCGILYLYPGTHCNDIPCGYFHMCLCERDA